MGRINVTSTIFAEPLGSNIAPPRFHSLGIACRGTVEKGAHVQLPDAVFDYWLLSVNLPG